MQQQPSNNNPIYGMSKYKLQHELSLAQKRLNSPKIDLVESGDKYIIRLEISGVRLSNVSFELQDDQIVLFTIEKELVEEQNQKVIYRECRYGKFMRKVKLPSKAFLLPETVQLEHGVYIVHFQKQSA